MNSKTKLLITALVIIALAAAGYFAFFNGAPEDRATIVGGDRDAHGCIGSAGYSWCEAKQACIRVWEEYCTAAAPTTAPFTCDGGNTIAATFYPADDLYADLVLNGERKLSVPRTISASGARYAKPDESLVFWNKGDTAFITENGTTTFTNCAIPRS